MVKVLVVAHVYVICNKQCFHTLLLPLRAQISAIFTLVIQCYVL